MDIEDTQKVDVTVDLPFALLQTLRLVQAICEAGFRICIDPVNEKKVIALKDVFGLDYRVGTTNVSKVSGLYVDHMTPVTRIGRIQRPLIMPVAVFDYCRQRWRGERKVDVSFAGYLTDSRREAINHWLRISRLEQLSIPGRPNFFKKALQQFVGNAGNAAADYVGTQNVKIHMSDQGRVFPRKSWNTDYYNLLLDSKFVLCPSGDHKDRGVTWTYRFFEAVLCGAVPVVEEPSDIYDGYRYRMMNAPIGSLLWSQEDAEHNFARAREQLTLGREELRSEVLGLLREPTAVLGNVHKDFANGIYAT